MSATSRPNDAQALEMRLGARIGAALAEGADALPHDITERLRVAREQAVLVARQARRVVPAATSDAVLVGASRGAGVLGSPVPWWQRAASMVPLIVLVVGLIAIGRFTEREQVRAAAEIDTLLLADDLPPAAYSDPGFAEFLRSSPP
jgi:hypothetical protein